MKKFLGDTIVFTNSYNYVVSVTLEEYLMECLTKEEAKDDQCYIFKVKDRIKKEDVEEEKIYYVIGIENPARELMNGDEVRNKLTRDNTIWIFPIEKRIKL